MPAKTLRVLFLEGSRRVGWDSAPEYDIAAQGASIEEARINFRDTLLGQVELDKQKGRENPSPANGQPRLGIGRH